MQLDQVKAVVTGGVSGLGFAVAKHLIANGASVALLDINDEKGAAAAAESVKPDKASTPTRTRSRARAEPQIGKECRRTLAIGWRRTFEKPRGCAKTRKKQPLC